MQSSLIRRYRGDRQEPSARELGGLRAELQREGLVAVPQKPSTEMIIVGSRIGEISPQAVVALYQAMLREADRR